MRPSDLEELRKNDRALTRLLRTYSELKSMSLVKGQEISGMPFSGGLTDSTGKHAEKLMDIEIEYKMLAARNHQLQNRALIFIRQIPDRVLSTIIHKRYIYCMDLWEIAEETGIKEREIKSILQVFLHNLF